MGIGTEPAPSLLEEEERDSRPNANGAVREFSPIFVVGCQRSGTTALAVMFDRHSRIAMLPETQFFGQFAKKDRQLGKDSVSVGSTGDEAERTKRELVRRALSDREIVLTQLEDEEILAQLGPGMPSYEQLFRALLLAYTAKYGKDRCGEKSCGHLFSARKLLQAYPRAKIVCIVRDGRDVVRSLRKTSWAGTVPVDVACLEWLRSAYATQELERSLPKDSFTVVRYEDLMTSPGMVMRRLCAFVGEAFEPCQLEAGASTDVVPDSETEWKGKAKEAPDSSRIEAWRRADPMLVARMNLHMGAALRLFGYADTSVHGVPRHRVLAWWLAFLPFRQGVYRLTRGVYRALRALGLAANLQQR